MITYIYFVKRPGCEDEHFDFFEEAREFAMGCLTEKPIIIQIEVDRNDFGECTDHCDLGTVWSWEDIMKKTDAEPTTSVFNKDDLKLMADGKDPEFDAIDNSVDFEIPEVSEREPITEAKTDSFHEAIFEAIDYLTEFNDIFPVPDNIGADSWVELKDDIRYGLSSDFEIAEIIMEYLDKDLAISRKHPEMFEDDPQSELTLETYNRLKRAYDRAVAAYEAEHPEDFEESCEKKPITEDVTTTLSAGQLTEFGDYLKQIASDWRTRQVSVDEIVEPSNDFGEDEISASIYWDIDKNAFEFELSVYHSSIDNNFEVGPDGYLTDDYYETYATIEELYNDYPTYVEYLYNEYKSSTRKPVPEGMTIEQLKEEMEENEDTVECTLCNDLFDKSECRKELNLGWLCRRCADDLAARGEGPVFKEDNYWDFLDEDAELKEASLSDIAAAANSEFGSSWNSEDLLDISGVEDDFRRTDIHTGMTPSEKAKYEREQAEEKAYKAKLARWKNYQKSKQEDLEPEAVHDLGNEYDGGYPAETSEVSDSHLKLCPECGKEAFDMETGICVECGFN